jgi:hypothetical protein
VRLRRHIAGVKQPRRLTTPLVAAMAVPIVLLVLLIMPRVLGVSLFPSGFPLLGTAPVATITITPESKTLQNTYLLTASPQVSAPDVGTRVIPASSLNTTAMGSRSAQTSGTKLISGTRARGSIFFQNGSEGSIFVPAGTIFTTEAGEQIRLTESVDVSPGGFGQTSSASGSAIAVNPGVDGNIAANTLDATCCNGLSVSNPQPFTGGVDPHFAHLVTQADLDSVDHALSPTLEQQALQQLQKQLKTNEVLASQPAYSTIVSSNYPVGAQVDQVLVQVSVSAAVTAYNRSIASHLAAQLLSDEATQTFGHTYKLESIPSVALPRVVQQGKNGLIYLSVSTYGRWVYAFSAQQSGGWLQSIKGAPSALALAYLNAQPGVAAVRIQLPFGTDHLPSSINQIKIVLGD